MEVPSTEQITLLLGKLADGKNEARDALMPLVYDELRALAAANLRGERVDHTLQPTALVHEAYLKLVDQRSPEFRNRAHFFALAARAMRQILVDHARGRSRLKRGGGQTRLTLQPDQPTPTELSIPDVVAIDAALEKLGALDARKAQLVELRFFGGLSIDESAEVLGIARSTASDEWRFARAWLRRELAGGDR